MHIHRRKLVPATLALLTAMNAQAAQPACGTHPVAAAVSQAVRRDAQDKATRIARQQVVEHAPGAVPQEAAVAVWRAVASHFPHRSTAKAAPAAHAPDCP
jgi:hypothetical protein